MQGLSPSQVAEIKAAYKDQANTTTPSLSADQMAEIQKAYQAQQPSALQGAAKTLGMGASPLTVGAGMLGLVNPNLKTDVTDFIKGAIPGVTTPDNGYGTAGSITPYLTPLGDFGALLRTGGRAVESIAPMMSKALSTAGDWLNTAKSGIFGGAAKGAANTALTAMGANTGSQLLNNPSDFDPSKVAASGALGLGAGAVGGGLGGAIQKAFMPSQKVVQGAIQGDQYLRTLSGGEDPATALNTALGKGQQQLSDLRTKIISPKFEKLFNLADEKLVNAESPTATSNIKSVAKQLSQQAISLPEDYNSYKNYLTQLASDPLVNTDKSFKALYDLKKNLDDETASQIPGMTTNYKKTLSYGYSQLANAAREDLKALAAHPNGNQGIANEILKNVPAKYKIKSNNTNQLLNAFNDATNSYENKVVPLLPLDHMKDGNDLGNLITTNKAQKALPLLNQLPAQTVNKIKAGVLNAGSNEFLPNAPGMLSNYDALEAGAPHLFNKPEENKAGLFNVGDRKIIANIKQTVGYKNKQPNMGTEAGVSALPFGEHIYTMKNIGNLIGGMIDKNNMLRRPGFIDARQQGLPQALQYVNSRLPARINQSVNYITPRVGAGLGALLTNMN